ncbi:hypothetical protein R9C00_18460 [Flammeovirgaceae bacterium SG7u.111]|nr:hypothetical protein [Flammeovirgaceae bacterium SG7u.132]WPO33688.1 hypothetical protein R9C00_18460 [Flammeovirgaceae bacterium SG7u.111]
MKKLLFLLLLAPFSTSVFAQSQGISYQAFIASANELEIPGIDIDGPAVQNAPISLRFTIISETGTIEYQEIQNTSTDEYGMINVIIAEGEITAESPGNFTNIDWNGLPKNLKVEISLEENGNIFEQFSEQALYFVPYAFHRNITATGTLIVDGASTLNSSLNVKGATTLNNTLNVTNESTSNLSGILNVDGASNLNELNVSKETNLNGQVTISTSLTGGETSYGAYPLRVEGSNQGVAIKVNGTRNSGKNFLTFMDAAGVQGRIEGQTLSELHNSFRYIWDITLQGIDVAAAVAEAAAAAAQFPSGPAEAAAVSAYAGLQTAHYTEWIIDQETSIGIAFESGGADYAEFLEKNDPSETFLPGEVVGVIGGKISKNTADADHLMVISTNPIVVGNLPKQKEETKYEKVAFIGQVPVRVAGKVAVGDYILPSQNNDGIGVAVSPSEMTVEDYNKIIGIAWSESQNAFTSLVNVAVGINTNDLAAVVAKQEKQLQAMQQQIDQIMAMLAGDTLETPQVISKTTTQSISTTDTSSTLSISKQLAESHANGKTFSAISDQEFEKWLTDYGYIFEETMADLNSFFASKNVDVSNYPEVKSIIENPTEALRNMRSGKYMPTLWQSLEKRHLQHLRD